MSGIIFPPTPPSTGVAFSGITGLPTTLSGYGITDAAAKAQTFFWSWYIQTVANGDIKLIANIPTANTIASLTAISCAGTCTLTGKINSTALGSSANAVSTVEGTVTHSSNNAMSIGDDFLVTLSANASCAGLTLTAKVTTTLS